MHKAAVVGVQRLVVSLLLLASHVRCNKYKCDVDQSVCEFHLEFEHHLTMMSGKSLVVARDGLLYPFDAVNLTASAALPVDDVITMDGWPEPRVVIAVNGRVPGPTIEVHEGQTVRVHVRNRMMSESTSLHFHGMDQRGTPWMDGVSFVSQCPILPGQTFTYQVKVKVKVKYFNCYLDHRSIQEFPGMTTKQLRN
jgi:hypothetical protein